MFTNTMSLDDKYFEIFRTHREFYYFFLENRKVFMERLNKRTSSDFPYYNRFSVFDDKANEWNFLFSCKSKEHRKKGLYLCYAYTIYEIPPMRKENQTNSGKGFIFFYPEYFCKFYLCKEMNEDEKFKIPIIHDVVPHAMNRYNERFLKRRGLSNLDFKKKVEMVLSKCETADILMELHGDISSEKHLSEDLSTCGIDLIIRNSGIIRGRLYDNNHYAQYYTFVSNDMLYQNQIERVRDSLNEWRKFPKEHAESNNTLYESLARKNLDSSRFLLIKC